MSKAVERPSKISIEDLEAALASLRASTTESKGDSFASPLLEPDWLLPRALFRVRKAETWLNNSFECFCTE